MEVKFCNVSGISYCIWNESGMFLVEDVEVSKFLLLSNCQLSWFVENIVEKYSNCFPFFVKNGRDGFDATRFSKFYGSSGWITR